MNPLNVKLNIGLQTILEDLEGVVVTSTTRISRDGNMLPQEERECKKSWTVSWRAQSLWLWYRWWCGS